jgi:hypothetical protein
VSSWRLAAVIAVIAAVLGALQISSEASNAVTFGRDQHLAQLNAAVVKLTQNLEDERDLSTAYAAHGGAGPVPASAGPDGSPGAVADDPHHGVQGAGGGPARRPVLPRTPAIRPTAVHHRRP